MIYQRIIGVVAWLRDENDRNRTRGIAFQAGRLSCGCLGSFGVIEVSRGAFLMLFMGLRWFEVAMLTWDMLQALAFQYPHSHVGRWFAGYPTTICGRTSREYKGLRMPRGLIVGMPVTSFEG